MSNLIFPVNLLLRSPAIDRRAGYVVLVRERLRAGRFPAISQNFVHQDRVFPLDFPDLSWSESSVGENRGFVYVLESFQGAQTQLLEVRVFVLRVVLEALIVVVFLVGGEFVAGSVGG